jgi:alginate O-acetyltransferase complex protein AlgI
MLFNSLEFVIFILLFIPLHAILRGRLWRITMVVASYIFYGWANPYYCILLLFSTVLDFNVGQQLAKSDNEIIRKRWLLFSLVGNVGILGLFKYSGFLIRSLNDIGMLVHIDLGLISPEIILPVGISFYTFQTLSYTIDIYRGKMDATDNFLSFALFVAFFPQLVAGPIERARDLLPQLHDKQPRTAEDVMVGMTRILWGLTKKVVFADNIAHYVNIAYDVASIETITNSEIVLATWLFAFQIYFDFSAYSDIAIGLARMMGIRLNENFNHPYISKNIGEFWRRWHISLSTWLRDYLYFPLGGSRKGLTRTIINVLIVFFLGGLWHGANVKFVIWGLWIGIAIGVYNLLATRFNLKLDPSGQFRVRDLLGIFVTFQIISISWVFFRANSVGLALTMFQKLITVQDWASTGVWNSADHADIHQLLLFVSAAHLLRGIDLDRRLHHVRNPILIGMFWSTLLIIMFIFHAEVTERFIYFQF